MAHTVGDHVEAARGAVLELVLRRRQAVRSEQRVLALVARHELQVITYLKRLSHSNTLGFSHEWANWNK